MGMRQLTLATALLAGMPAGLSSDPLPQRRRGSMSELAKAHQAEHRKAHKAKRAKAKLVKQSRARNR